MSIQRMYFPFQTMKANPGSNGRISNQSTSCMDKKKREENFKLHYNNKIAGQIRFR